MAGPDGALKSRLIALRGARTVRRIQGSQRAFRPQEAACAPARPCCDHEEIT